MSTVTISAGTFGPGAGTVRGRAAVSTDARRRRPEPARLTRRGRLVVTLVLLAGFLAGGVLMAGNLASAGTEPGAETTATRVSVEPGESLWSIAQREAPGSDPRDTVEDILRLNHLDSVAVEAGSVLLMP